MSEIVSGFIALDKGAVLNAIQEGLDTGRDPLELVDEARRGLDEVGERFDRREFFLMELMRAAQILQAAAGILNPAIQAACGNGTLKGRVLLGTVAGDIHDLGKNIVKILLECRGVEGIDLGVDVPVDSFVEHVRKTNPDVVGMSALLTASIPQMKETINAIDAAGLRNDPKVIVGGGIVGEVSLGEMETDHATVDANEGVRMITEWIEQR
jgi:5-methyltetrahydrofolate--homocysteine methyltransferase